MMQIRVMIQADLAAAMRLKEQANWNQTLADWERFLALEPRGCFVAQSDEQVVGTTTCCIMGQVAWIAMVLVDQALRGRGIGKALMQHALSWLDEQGVASVRLDATPLGRPLYEKLGFTGDYELARFEGVAPVSGPASAGLEVGPLGAADLDQVIELDFAATAASRGKLLRRLHADEPSLMSVTRQSGLCGYLGGRPGIHAVQVGPCIARDEAAGLALLSAATADLTGRRVFVDLPLPNTRACAWAQGAGLRVQRPFLRMTRGRRLSERLDWLWASSGPETG